MSGIRWNRLKARRTRTGWLPAALLALCVTGCDAAVRAGTFAVRDSAGVRIEENSAASWREGTGWRIGDAHVLQIGTLDGPDAYQFSRIATVDRLADGRIQLPGSISGVFDDGTLLAIPPLSLQVDAGKPLRLDLTLLHYSADGEALDTLGRAPGPEILIGVPGMASPPFARQFVSAVHGIRFYHGSGDGYEIRVYTAAGTLERVIRALHRDLTLTEAMRDAYRRERRTAANDEAARVQIERALADIRFPSTIPPYTRMLVDADAHLWVEDYRLPGQTGPANWSVFNRDGRLLGPVAMPERFHPHQIDSDAVIGVWTDDADVPYVRLYPLHRR